MSQELCVEFEDGIAIAEVMSKKVLDEAHIQKLGKELFALTDERKIDKIVLDMRRVEYMSSAANGKWITFDRKMRVAGGRWAICGVRPEIYEVFKITRLSRVFRIVRDREEAIAWLKGIGSGQVLLASVECPLKDCGTTIVFSYPESFRQPPYFEAQIVECSACGATFSLYADWNRELKTTSAHVQQIQLNTYEAEHVELQPSMKVERGCSQQIHLIRVVGRLDLYVAETIVRLWSSLRKPRWIILDLSQATEISEKGLQCLLECRDSDPILHRTAVLLPAEGSDLVSAHFPHGANLNEAVDSLGELPKGISHKLNVVVRQADARDHLNDGPADVTHSS